MTNKEFLNRMCAEYQSVILMSEVEVLEKYEETKEECLASFEEEIDYWETVLYNY